MPDPAVVFNLLVEEKKGRGVPGYKAIAEVAREHPTLHGEWLAQVNPHRAGEIRKNFGIRR